MQPGRSPAPYLGHVHERKWEIRSAAMGAALEEVVGALLKDGTLLPVELGGLEGGKLAPKASKPQVKTAQGGAKADAVPARKRARKGGGGGGKIGYVVANRYTLGEAFKVVDARAAAAAQQATAGGADMEVDEAAAAAEEEEEEEEQLSEYELARAQNIMRNQAFLESLGLA